MTPRIFETGMSVYFWPGSGWIVGAGAGAETGVGVVTGAGVAVIFSKSLDVMDPSNPEPLETDANESPFSAAKARASGEAKIRSVFAGEGVAVAVATAMEMLVFKPIF